MHVFIRVITKNPLISLCLLFLLEFSGLFYCSVIKVLCCCLCLRQRVKYYHIFLSLSTSFLYFIDIFNLRHPQQRKSF